MPHVIATTNSWTTSATLDLEYDRTIWGAWSTASTWGTRSTSSTDTVVVQLSNAISARDAVIWTSWNTALIHATNHVVRHFQQPITPEQRAADREAYVRAEGERAKAREKAEILLREHLLPKQKEELSLHGHFHVEIIARSGERRRYRIERGRSRNIKQVTADGRIIKTLCAHPVMDVPDADTMLAQKLYLEAEEDEFLRIANHS